MGDDHHETSARVPGVRADPEAARAPAPLGHRADLRLEQHACRTTRGHERLVASHDTVTSRTTAPPRADRYVPLRSNAKSRPFFKS